MWTKAILIDDNDNDIRWIVEWTNGVYFSVTKVDFENGHQSVFFQGDDCYEPLEKWDQLGLLEFLDWFYMMGFDIAFQDITNDTLKYDCDRLNIEIPEIDDHE